MKLRCLSKLAVCVLLSSCGGGGSTSSSSPVVTIPSIATPPSTSPALPVANAAFGTAQTIADIARHLPDNCPSPFVSKVSLIDLRKSGLKDILVHVWCQTSPVGSTVSGTTPNRLIALLRQPDRSYLYGNQQIFGRDDVDLGGASRKVVTADVNGDGYLDLAYAVNREDLRSTTDPQKVTAKPAVVLSNGNGTYRVDILGNSDWIHTLDVAENAAGTADFVFQGFNNVGTQAFRYNGALVTNVSANYPTSLSGLTFKFFPRSASGQGADAVASGNQGTPSTLDFFKRLGNQWSVSSAFVWGSSPTRVPFITYSNDNTTVNLVSNNGKRFIAAGFQETCLIKFSPSESPKVIAQMNALVVPDSYSTTSGIALKESDLQQFNKLVMVLNQNTVPEERRDFLNSEDTSVNYNTFECRDINGDGYDDISIYPFNSKSGLPILYLNSKNNSFIKVDTGQFPTNLSFNVDSQSVFSDFDGDGVSDLLFHTQFFTSSRSIPLVLHRGVRQLIQ